jgi:hypothetical protein
MKGIVHGFLSWLSGDFSATGTWDLFAKIIVIVALLFLALAAFVRLGLGGRTLKHPAWRPILHHSFLHGLILGVTGLALGFFRYEQVLYLAGPWLMDLYLLVVIIWIVWIVGLLWRIPQSLEQQREVDRKQQWIKPSKRRKKRR